jgi:hypothetical protein
MEETGVWTKDTCDRLAASFTDNKSTAYKILHGGISFNEVDYVDFNDAMIAIGDEISSGTEESNSMHDYWEEAALLESTNNYD